MQAFSGMDSMPHLLSLVGIVALSKLALDLVSLIWVFFLRPSTSMTKFGAGKGAWALVTGASDGIGRALAMELAEKGFNVAIMARSKAKMEDIKHEIAETFPKVAVLVIEADASLSTSPAAVIKAMEGRDVRVLVNNVGINTEIPTELSETSEQDISRIIAVNTTFSTQLTRLAIPLLKQSKHSAIINMSSLSAVKGCPLMSVYAATKAYNKVFSMSLSTELAPYGVEVVSYTPSFVASSMSGFRRGTASGFVLSAQDFARASLDKFGARVVMAPTLMHNLIVLTLSTLPRAVIDHVIRTNMIKTRKKLLRKKAAVNKDE